jgi:hypothetical protein
VLNASAGDTIYVPGQIASDYKTSVPPEARTDPAFPYYGRHTASDGSSCK